VNWHAPPEILRTFAVEPEALDGTTASSVELHLLHCEPCRAVVAASVEPDLVAASWDAVADVMDRPRPRGVERLLERLGLDASAARLIAATRSLQVSALGALVAVAVGAVLFSRLADDPGPYLVFAPILPLAAVGAAFATGAEPAGEVAVVAPVAGVALVLRRSVAVLVASLAVVGAGSVALPSLGFAALAWVLPALALTTGALALSTWVRVETAFASLVAAWLGGLMLNAAWDAGHIPVADLALFSPGVQLAWFAAALGAIAVIWARRPRLATIGGLR
jgi:hypothetical protein